MEEAMKGIISYWGKDLKKIKNILLEHIQLINKVKCGETIKDNLLSDINKVLALMRKGKAHEREDNKDTQGEPEVHSEQRIYH